MSNRPLDWSVPVSRSSVACFKSLVSWQLVETEIWILELPGIIRPPVCCILPFLRGPDCLPLIIIISGWRRLFSNKEDEVVAYPAADSVFDLLNNNSIAVRTDIDFTRDATSTSRCAQIIFFTSHAPEILNKHACQMQDPSYKLIAGTWLLHSPSDECFRSIQKLSGALMAGVETADNGTRKSIFWIAQHSNEIFVQRQLKVPISVRDQSVTALQIPNLLQSYLKHGWLKLLYLDIITPPINIFQGHGTIIINSSCCWFRTMSMPSTRPLGLPHKDISNVSHYDLTQNWYFSPRSKYTTPPPKPSCWTSFWKSSNGLANTS